MIAASFTPTMQNVASTCQTRVTRGAKLGGGFVDGFLLLLFILNEYFFQRIFPKLLIIFFRSGRWLREKVGSVRRNRTGGGRRLGGLSGNTREKGMNFLITFF